MISQKFPTKNQPRLTKFSNLQSVQFMAKWLQTPRCTVCLFAHLHLSQSSNYRMYPAKTQVIFYEPAGLASYSWLVAKSP